MSITFSNITCVKFYSIAGRLFARVNRITYKGKALQFTLTGSDHRDIIETMEAVYPDWVDVDQQAARAE